MYSYDDIKTALIEAGIAEEAIRPGNTEWAAMVEGHGGITRLDDDTWLAANPGVGDTPIAGPDPLKLVGNRGRGRPPIGPMINVRISEDTVDVLDEVAEHEQIARAELIRRAVDHYLATRSGR